MSEETPENSTRTRWSLIGCLAEFAFFTIPLVLAGVIGFGLGIDPQAVFVVEAIIFVLILLGMACFSAIRNPRIRRKKP